MSSPDFAKMAAQCIDDTSWPYNLAERFRESYQLGAQEAQEELERLRGVIERAKCLLKDQAPLHALDELEGATVGPV